MITTLAEITSFLLAYWATHEKDILRVINTLRTAFATDSDIEIIVRAKDFDPKERMEQIDRDVAAKRQAGG